MREIRPCHAQYIMETVTAFLGEQDDTGLSSWSDLENLRTDTGAL